MRRIEQEGDNSRCCLKAKSCAAVSVREMVTELTENTILPQHVQFRCVANLWKQVLPAELFEHCRIAGISGGRLKVVVDSPSYMYELQLCSSKILAELQRRCPQARIKRIKLTIS